MRRSWCRRTARAGALILAAAVAASCASPSPRARLRRAVIGGTEAPGGAYPETVALMDLAYGDPASYTCTATLVAPDLVVSAAHCLYDWHDARRPDSDFGVYVGHDARQQPLAQVVRVTRSFIPDTYPRGEVTDPVTGMGRDDDIALLVLAAPITDVPPAPILEAARVASLARGTMLLLVGFGATSLDGTGPDGVKFYGSSPVQQHGDHEMVIGAPGQPDTCNGDSGGPAFLDVGGTRTLVGVTVGGALNTTVDCGEGGIYTLVPPYLDWMEQALATIDGGSLKPDGRQADGPGEADAADLSDGGDGHSSGGCTVAGNLTGGQSPHPRVPARSVLGVLLVLLVLRGRVPGPPRHRTPI